MQKSQRSQKKLRFLPLLNKHELRTYIRFAADEGAGSL